jgi:hypothetical protein
MSCGKIFQGYQPGRTASNDSDAHDWLYNYSGTMTENQIKNEEAGGGGQMGLFWEEGSCRRKKKVRIWMSTCYSKSNQVRCPGHTSGILTIHLH